MTYITQKQREEINFRMKDADEGLVNWRRQITFGEPLDDEQVKYVIAKLIDYVYGHKYATFKDHTKAQGVLESIKQEFYHRKIQPYQEQQRYDNGDLNE